MQLEESIFHNYEKTANAAKLNADRLKRNGFEVISIQKSTVVTDWVIKYRRSKE